MKVIKTILNLKPKANDKVKVKVGFNPYFKEGVVSKICEDYCWIDRFNSRGEYLNSFTASFSYVKFKYL